ncbi:unnamed protein product [Peronospora destructor]|uniref:Gem-associated protein 5 TPR domain-containing protein n=1 Tax=Peronospora destructor TaxID=86335 RepID=A0AAV0V902_9STRA|nr:unnamed protein product [Peronospora destructor]
MLDANFVVAGDRQGQISAWEPDVGKVFVFMPISDDGVHSMAISPHDKALIAVGYRSGVLCLLDATKGTMRHRLAGHDQEVQCVAWKSTVTSPNFAREGSMNSPDQEIWLASSSRDNTINVWKVSLSGKQSMSYTQTKQLWLPIAWSLNSLQKTVDKHSLWSGSFDGSLLRWEWNVAKINAQRKEGKNRRGTYKPVVVKGGHSRMLFGIVMVPPWGSGMDANEAVSMLTVSLDREIRLWKENLSSKSLAAVCVEKLSGLGGHVYSVSYNAATGLVAAGIGDQTIRLWQLDIDTSSVTSAYQCGLLGVTEQDHLRSVASISSVFASLRHDEEVQQLQWIVRKPKKAEGNDKRENSYLGSIKQLEAAQAEGQSLENALIVQESQTRRCDGDDLKVFLWSYDTGGALLESNADVVDQKSRKITLNNVAFEWDEQCELVAIWRANGVVEVMKWEEGAYNNSTVVHRFHEHLASVTRLAWSKVTAMESGEVVRERLLGSLAGHLNKIIDLRWWCSDECQSFLASSFADGPVKVWNLASFQREAYFNYHAGRVLSLDWVLLYTLVTGGEDQTLRFWDFKEQQKEALPKLKKHDKVKQPQKVDTQSISPLADNCNAQLLTNKAPKKKRLVIFHSDTKLTPTDIASACCSVAGVKPEASGTKPAKNANEAINNLLAHTDRVSLRGFFTSECRRFREEREWESLANTLLIQGNITEALRIVAKEGALTPTWLSYAPVAGMDVWRQMTNLYAHQLDAQGDKKAAFHFLSIAKVRSAVGLFGDMIYIKSALDVLLAAMKYQEKVADEYEAERQNDVEKLSFPASFFISIASQALVKARLDIAGTAGYLLQSWLAGASSSATHRLTWCLVGVLKSVDEHQLAHYVINEADDKVVAERVDILRQSDSRESVCEFFNFLTNSRVDESDDEGGDRLYDLVVEEHAFSNVLKRKQCKQWLLDRADHFWYKVLSVFRRCGYWFDADRDVHIQKAQDVLIEASCFNGIEKAAAMSAREAQNDSIISSLQVAQRLLRFVMDVMSTSFIGALKHMREIFLLLAQDKIVTSTRDTNAISMISERASYPIASAERLDMMMLLYPGSFASPKKLPQCGELAKEQLDTLVLWSSILLSQCKLFVASLTPIAKQNERTDVQSLIQSLLRRLRFWFLHDKATTPFSQSLMNAGNQSQLRMLLNEMLVVICRPTTSQKEDERCCADERQAKQKEETSKYMSKKQALIDDVEDI